MPYKNDKKRLTEHRAFILRMQERETRSPAKNVKIIIIPMSMARANFWSPNQI